MRNIKHFFVGLTFLSSVLFISTSCNEDDSKPRGAGAGEKLCEIPSIAAGYMSGMVFELGDYVHLVMNEVTLFPTKSHVYLYENNTLNLVETFEGDLLNYTNNTNSFATFILDNGDVYGRGENEKDFKKLGVKSHYLYGSGAGDIVTVGEIYFALGASSKTIYKSTDYGVTWTSFTNNNSDRFESLASDGENLYAARKRINLEDTFSEMVIYNIENNTTTTTTVPKHYPLYSGEGCIIARQTIYENDHTFSRKHNEFSIYNPTTNTWSDFKKATDDKEWNNIDNMYMKNGVIYASLSDNYGEYCIYRSTNKGETFEFFNKDQLLGVGEKYFYTAKGNILTGYTLWRYPI